MEYFICELCAMAIVNNDFTSIDYYYNGSEADEKLQAIKQGIAELPEIYITEDEPSFMKVSCDCCCEQLHGNRFIFKEM